MNFEEFFKVCGALLVSLILIGIVLTVGSAIFSLFVMIACKGLLGVSISETLSYRIGFFITLSPLVAIGLFYLFLKARFSWIRKLSVLFKKNQH